MRISDWSSDVCSSDLSWRPAPTQPPLHAMVAGCCTHRFRRRVPGTAAYHFTSSSIACRRLTEMRDGAMGCLDCLSWQVYSFDVGVRAHSNRSEERRGGKEWVSTVRSRWSPYP